MCSDSQDDHSVEMETSLLVCNCVCELNTSHRFVGLTSLISTSQRHLEPQMKA